MIRTLLARPSQEMNSGSSVSFLNVEREHAVEDRGITWTHDGAHVKMKNQIQVDRFFCPDGFGSPSVCALG